MCWSCSCLAAVMRHGQIVSVIYRHHAYVICTIIWRLRTSYVCEDTGINNEIDWHHNEHVPDCQIREIGRFLSRIRNNISVYATRLNSIQVDSESIVRQCIFRTSTENCLGSIWDRAFRLNSKKTQIMVESSKELSVVVARWWSSSMLGLLQTGLSQRSKYSRDL